MLERQLAILAARVIRGHDQDAAKELGILLTRCNKVGLQEKALCSLEQVVGYANTAPTTELVAMAWTLAFAENKLPALSPEAFSYSDTESLPSIELHKKACITYKHNVFDGNSDSGAGRLAYTLFWDGSSWFSGEFDRPRRRRFRWHYQRVQYAKAKAFTGTLMDLLDFMREAKLYKNGKISKRSTAFFEDLYAEYKQKLFEHRLQNFENDREIIWASSGRPTLQGSCPWSRIRAEPNPDFDKSLPPFAPDNRRYLLYLADTSHKAFDCEVQLEVSDINIQMFANMNQEDRKLLRSWSRVI